MLLAVLQIVDIRSRRRLHKHKSLEQKQANAGPQYFSFVIH